MDDTPIPPDVFARSILTPAFKFSLIAGLVIVLLVPIALVSQPVGEREQHADSVRSEIATLRGGPQLINGPFLVVPYSVVRVRIPNDKPYLVLQLEDYALLAGAILGFILLTSVMFSMLRVNWSGHRDGEPVPPQPVEDRA